LGGKQERHATTSPNDKNDPNTHTIVARLKNGAFFSLYSVNHLISSDRFANCREQLVGEWRDSIKATIVKKVKYFQLTLESLENP
jgi:hypothetical protein